MTQDQTTISTQSEQIDTGPENETVFCTYHPDQPTVLRCNRCGTPICYRCAIRTPVGYRCRQCVRSQQAVYFNAHASDPLVAAVVAFVVAAVAGALAWALLGILGLLFGVILAIFAGPVAGGVIAEAVRASVGRRRSRNLKWYRGSGKRGGDPAGCPGAGIRRGAARPGADAPARDLDRAPLHLGLCGGCRQHDLPAAAIGARLPFPPEGLLTPRPACGGPHPGIGTEFD